MGNLPPGCVIQLESRSTGVKDEDIYKPRANLTLEVEDCSIASFIIFILVQKQFRN